MSASSTTAPGTSNAGSTTRRVTTKAFLGGFKSWRTPIGIKGLFKGSSGSNGGRIGGIGGIVGGGSILVRFHHIANAEIRAASAQRLRVDSPGIVDRRPISPPEMHPDASIGAVSVLSPRVPCLRARP